MLQIRLIVMTLIPPPSQIRYQEGVDDVIADGWEIADFGNEQSGFIFL